MLLETYTCPRNISFKDLKRENLRKSTVADCRYDIKILNSLRESFSDQTISSRNYHDAQIELKSFKENHNFSTALQYS